MTNSINLEIAIEELDATKLPDGDYAYYDDGTGRYYIVDDWDLAQLGKSLAADEPDAYSLWCGVILADEMAHGWEPRFAGKVVISLSSEDSHAVQAVEAIAEDARFNDPEFSGAEIVVETHADDTCIFGGDEISGARLLSTVREAIAGVQS